MDEVDIVSCFEETNLVKRSIAEVVFKDEVKNISNWNPSRIQQWAQKQVESDYPILSTKEYEEYWCRMEIDTARKEAEVEETISYYQTRKEFAKRSNDQNSYQDQRINKKQKQYTGKETVSTAEITEECDNHIHQGEMGKNIKQEQAEQWIQKLHSLSDENKLLFIYEKFGKENSLDLTERVYPSRYWTHISQLVNFLGLPHYIVQDEAEWLRMIRECEGLEELYMVKQHFFKEAHVSSGREYIRSTLHKILLLWESDELYRQNNEEWYQINLYGPLFDDVFLQEKKYDTKRTECASTAIEAYNELLSLLSPSTPLPTKHQKHKVDFALHDLNSGLDIMIGEDKPSRTPHKDISDTITKNKRVRVAALNVLQNKLPVKNLISEFDEYTTFWHGTDLKICGTRRIRGIDIHYEAAHVCLSRVPGDFKGLVKLMIIILSIKRQSIKVYEQLEAINYAIFDLSLEYPSVRMLPNSSKEDSFEFNDTELQQLLDKLPCPPDEKQACIENAIYNADVKFKKIFLTPSKLYKILVNPEYIEKKTWYIEPKIDLVEEESGSLNVRVELPGIEKRNIELGIKGNVLSVEAKNQSFYKDTTNILVQECNSHNFQREITLPVFARASDCSPSFENGVLTIKIKPPPVHMDKINML